MRLWRLGKNRNQSQAEYVAIDNTHEQKTVHLFRALLRQCTYLPDPAARHYLHRHVVSRFRAYHPKNILPAKSRGSRRLSVVGERRESLLKTARRAVVFLERANDGHPRHLGKILAMTYGRIGKRRHELLQALKIPDVPTSQAAVEMMNDPKSQGLPRPSRQLLALVRSHARRTLTFFSRSNRPTQGPQIPETNAWGRPTPVRRVRNIKRRWYSETLDRVMPPLPEDEWNRLKGLASGEAQWDGPVSRRGQKEKVGFKHGTFRGMSAAGFGLRSSPHELTPRYMRRLWSKIFAQCPLMKPNKARKMGWDVRWGDIHDNKTFVLQSRDEKALAMFEGVDDRGKVIEGLR